MATPLWIVHLVKKAFPKRFALAKLTGYPVLGRLIDRMLFDGDDIIYLPADGLLKIDSDIEDHGSMVLPSMIVEHFIEKAGTHWIMDSCLCRSASGCTDYPVDLGCLFLGEASLGINPKLGRRVTKDEAFDHERRCREAGLVQMIGRNKLDSVWLNVGPGNRLLTICNCCPCCCLWRFIPQLNERIASKVTRMPGVSVVVGDVCIDCGTCTDGVCFAGAITRSKGRASIGDACRGCGRCVEVCPQGSISLTVRGDRFVVDSIDRLESLVDVT